MSDTIFECIMRGDIEGLRRYIEEDRSAINRKDFVSLLNRFYLLNTLSLCYHLLYLIDKPQVGWTALHCAVYKGHLDCAQLLVQAGAVIDIQDNVRTLDVHTVYRHVSTHEMPY